MAFNVKSPFNKDAHFAALKAAAQASKEEKKDQTPSNSTELARKAALPKPEDCSERIRIVFDDSGSMAGEKIENAKAGVVEFLRNCIPGQTAVAIHLLNGSAYYEGSWSEPDVKLPAVIDKATLSSDLVLVASACASEGLQATGGTPLEQKLLEALKDQPRASRIVAFSDGQPDSKSQTQDIINRARENNIPIDTVFLSSGSDYYGASAAEYMKHLAEATGGIFLHFKKGSSFRESFKYLAPPKRLMLMDKTFKEKVERGEV